jgi:nicotinamide-nucleotide amidase
MKSENTAVILSVGTELTEGTILNTHFRFLGAELKGLGFHVLRSIQIPDDRTEFRSSLSQALNDCNLVILTGGLGPTSDDLSREIVAEVAGVVLDFHSSIWEDLVARYGKGGRRISDTNRKQAQIPSGFTVLPNTVGTAPGFCGKIGGSLVVALPGPPAELEEMFLERAVPLILEDLETRRSSSPGRETTPVEELKATALMIPESLLEEALQKARGTNTTALWSTRVAGDRIALTLRDWNLVELERIFSELVERFGSVRMRRGDVRPSVLLYELLLARGQRIALAESCTGGLVAKLITDIPGSSQVFWGGQVAYSNAAKQAFLGVSEDTLSVYGAVSPQAASAMSESLLGNAAVDVSVAVTGIAGPAGGTPEKPVGTVWISARCRRGGELCRSFRFLGNRESIRRRSAVAAMLMAESVMLGLDGKGID